MKDLISRQDAIELVQKYHGKMPNEINHQMWKEANDLPSVQPEYTEQDMREQFNAGYACGMHAAQPESKREWYMKGYRDAQANIVQCEDCKWRRNRNGTMAWIPCRALVTPDDFYCKYAERKEQ